MEELKAQVSSRDKQAIQDYIQNGIRLRGFCDRPSLAVFIRNSRNIDWNKASEGADFRDWICSLLPQYQWDAQFQDHLVEAGRVPKPEYEALLARIDESIDQRGFCLCAVLGTVIPWRQYALPTEKKLAQFLARVLPENRYLIGSVNNADAVLRQEGATRAQRMQEGVYAFAFIPQSSELNRSVQELTEDSTITAAQWRETLTIAVGEYLLGKTGRVYDDSAGETPRLAVRLELKEARPIYGIFERNEVAQKQAWRLMGFAYPGLQDEKGWGRWLCSAFKLPSQDQETIQTSMATVEENVARLTLLQEQLLAQMEELERQLREGLPVQPELQEALRDYCALWEELDRATGAAFPEIPRQEMHSLGEVNKALKAKSDVNLQLEAVSDQFRTLAADTWGYLGRVGLCPEPEAGAERDGAAWVESSQTGDNSIQLLRSLLEPYRAFSSLAAPVSDFGALAGLEGAKKAVEDHFGVQIGMNELFLHFSMAAAGSPDTFGFLEGIETVEHLLTTVESAGDRNRGGVNVSRQTEARRLTGLELLKAVLAGERPFGSIQAAFPAPTGLEEAVLEGNQVRVRLCFDQTEEGAPEPEELRRWLEAMAKVPESLNPYNAGLRLALVGRNQSPQVERCFLLALALGNPKGAQGLSLLYSLAGRWEELELLLNYAREEGQAPLAKSIIEKLFGADRIDCRTVARTNVLLLLDRNNWDRIRERDPELLEEIETISARLEENTFARYVVYMDDQLRDYILVQDNVLELNRLGIQTSSEQLLQLVQTGNYARDTDALSTARRCYSFLGGWGGLVELLLGMIPEDRATRALRFRLARDQENRAAMLELLKQDEDLQEKNGDLYNDLLFDTGDFEAYLAAEGKDPLRRLVAEVKLGIWEGTLPDPEEIPPENYGLLRQKLTPEELEALSQAALEEDPCLAYYAAPESREAELLVQDILSSIKDRIQSEDQSRSAEAELRRVEILCPELLSGHQEELLGLRYWSALRLPEGRERSDRLVELTRQADSPLVGRQLLDLSLRAEHEKSLGQDPTLILALGEMCGRLGLEDQWLRLCRQRADLKNTDYAAPLLQTLTELLEEDRPEPEANRLEPEELTFWEGYLLKGLSDTQNPRWAFCLLLLEERLGSGAKTGFTLAYLQNKLDVLSEEEGQKVLDRMGDPELLAKNELELLQQALEEPGLTLAQYLGFCRCFRLRTDEDTATARSITRSYATELESGAVLHVLYGGFPSLESVQMAMKLPLYEDTKHYAKLSLALCVAASQRRLPQESDYEILRELWNRCGTYCLENELFRPLLDTMTAWADCQALRELNPLQWFHVKHLFALVDQASSVEWPRKEWEEAGDLPRLLTEKLVALFKRFNSISNGDKDHNSLRAVINLAVASGSEGVLLEDRAIMTAIYGPMKKLGYVLAIRLLRLEDEDRDGERNALRKERAMKLMGDLDKIGKSLPWHWLIHEIVTKPPQDRETWLAGPVGRSLIDLSLPDGNDVNESKLKAFVMRYLNRENIDDGINALKLLLEKQSDCMAYNALFVLCKGEPEKHLETLYDALRGMIATYPTEREMDGFIRDKRKLFSRSRAEMLQLCMAARVAMGRLDPERRGDIEAENPAFLSDIYQYGSRSVWWGSNLKTNIKRSVIGYYQSLYNRLSGLYNGWEDPEPVTLALLAYVSGNWVPFLKRVWVRDRDANLWPLFEVCCVSGKGAELPLPNLGLKRSCMLFMKDLPQSERVEFSRWLMDVCQSGGNSSLPKLYAIARELSIISRDTKFTAALRYYDIDNLHEDFLNQPLEEHFVCVGTWGKQDLEDRDDAESMAEDTEKSEEEPEIRSCFDWMKNNTSPNRLAATVNFFFSLAQDNTAGAVVTRYADSLFQAGKDDYAVGYYDGLHFAASKAPYQKILGAGNRKMTPTDRELKARFWAERYQARNRICGAFAGVETLLKKVGSREFNRHSVFNIVMELLVSERRREIYALCRFLHVNNRKYVLELMKCVCSDVEDETKLALLENRRNQNAPGSDYWPMAYLLSRKVQDPSLERKNLATFSGASYPYLRQQEQAEALRLEYDVHLREAGSAENNKQKPLPLLLWCGAAYSTVQLRQTEPEPSLEDEDLEDLREQTEDYDREDRQSRTWPNRGPQQGAPEEYPLAREERLPDFVLETGEYEAADRELDLEELRRHYARELSLNDYEARMTTARDIYLAVKDRGNDIDVNNAIVAYGRALYYFHHLSSAEGADPVRGDKVLRELAIWMQGKSLGRDQLTEMGSLTADALLQTLNGYPDLRELVEDFSANHLSYTAMAGLCDAKHLWLNDLVSVLAALTRRTAKLGPKVGNEESYRTLYSEVAEQVLNVRAERGVGREAETLKNKLHRLLHLAINQLDNRPDLELTLLNPDRGVANGAVYGELRNVSSFVIDSVTLLFTWTQGDQHRSSEYVYSNLQPQNRVAVALGYTTKPGLTSLDYQVSTAFVSHGRQLNLEPRTGSLRIEPRTEVELPANLYGSNEPVLFSLVEGQIVPSMGFYGREVQMARLRKNVAGDSFSRYNNQLIRGIRRSGKTSLLKYFEAYCKLHCQGAVPIYTDCQNVKRDLWTVFIKPVLNQLPEAMPELYDLEEWNRFENRWRAEAEDTADIDEFYRQLDRTLDQLGEVSRKNVLLIVDELSLLLQDIGREEAHQLLRTLRAVMQSRGTVVKFTFSASNDILRYNDGGVYSQFFQHFQVSDGTEIIVDDLPDEGMRELLQKPIEGMMELPQETLDWCYRYVGGLVWYTKLLGNAVLSQAVGKGRSVAYPSDVEEAFQAICTAGNCVQLREGCSDQELLLINAIGDMCPNYRDSVTQADLWSRVENRMAWQDFVNALTRLKLLRLIEPLGDEVIGFRKELYRRYFRSMIPTTVPTASDKVQIKILVSDSSLYGDDFT